MTDKNTRVEIPQEVAAEVLFLSDRTCCVCHQSGRPVQLHHIDNDPANSVSDNLAVLCFDCHRETQIRGGFDRKLNAPQVRLYKTDWVKRVDAQRNALPQPTYRELRSETQFLKYMQLREKSEEYLYDFDADYPLVGSDDLGADRETNLCIEGYISRRLQRFRFEAITARETKIEIEKQFPSTAWDSLAISHKLSLYSREMLSLEFQLASYGAGAAHPNYHTKTMNFRLRPSLELYLNDLLSASPDRLKVLSQYCINDLHRQQPSRWEDSAARTEQLKSDRDGWILNGAGPSSKNYEKFSLRRNGVVIHFDPYQVGSYAEGKYEVFIPAHEAKAMLQEEIVTLLGWN